MHTNHPNRSSAHASHLPPPRPLIGGGHDCQTAGYLVPGATVPDSALLAGVPIGFSGPWGTSYPTHLRLKLRELPEREWMPMVRQIPYIVFEPVFPGGAPGR